MMDRRGFIANAFIVLAAPLAAEAQEVGKIHQIGHVSLMSPAGMAPYVQEFEKALGQLGYVKGRNYVLINRSANDKPELVESAAAELVQLKVDVILTGINQGVAAARKATTTIPIVMVYGIDPVGPGFIQSLARPGGNVTGGAFEAAPEIYGKKIQLLKEIKPTLARVALLWNPASTRSMQRSKPPGVGAWARSCRWPRGCCSTTGRQSSNVPSSTICRGCSSWGSPRLAGSSRTDRAFRTTSDGPP